MRLDLVFAIIPAIFIALAMAWSLTGASKAMAQNPEASGTIFSLGGMAIACLEITWLTIFILIYIKL